MTPTTNYQNTFITIASDSAATTGIIPPKPDSIAGRHYALLHAIPYKLTSDDLLFAVHAAKHDLPETAQTRAGFLPSQRPVCELRCQPNYGELRCQFTKYAQFPL